MHVWANPLGERNGFILYAMMLVSAGLTSLGFSAYVVPVLAAIPYYAMPENDWLALLTPHLPKWIALFDAKASRLFFEGEKHRFHGEYRFVR